MFSFSGLLTTVVQRHRLEKLIQQQVTEGFHTVFPAVIKPKMKILLLYLPKAFVRR
jgi:hypothetical protein